MALEVLSTDLFPRNLVRVCLSTTGCPHIVNNAWLNTELTLVKLAPWQEQPNMRGLLCHSIIFCEMKRLWVSSEIAWVVWEPATSFLHGLVSLCLGVQPGRSMEPPDILRRITKKKKPCQRVPTFLFPQLQYLYLRALLDAFRNHYFLHWVV